MGSTRNRRVAELLRQELAGLLRAGLRDPRLTGLTVTEVEMTPDLKRAKVFYSCPGERAGETGQALVKAAGFIRRTLAQKIYLKYMPELVYSYDDTLDKGRAMDELLGSLGPEDSPDRALEPETEKPR